MDPNSQPMNPFILLIYKFLYFWPQTEVSQQISYTLKTGIELDADSLLCLNEHINHIILMGHLDDNHILRCLTMIANPTVKSSINYYCAYNTRKKQNF